LTVSIQNRQAIPNGARCQASLTLLYFLNYYVLHKEKRNKINMGDKGIHKKAADQIIYYLNEINLIKGA